MRVPPVGVLMRIPADRRMDDGHNSAVRLTVNPRVPEDRDRADETVRETGDRPAGNDREMEGSARVRRGGGVEVGVVRRARRVESRRNAMIRGGVGLNDGCIEERRRLRRLLREATKGEPRSGFKRSLTQGLRAA